MALTKHQHYPEHLNPFGSDDEEESESKVTSKLETVKIDDYPEYLSPFGDDGDNDCGLESSNNVADYDNSLNPFGEDDENDDGPVQDTTQVESLNTPVAAEPASLGDQQVDHGNPFNAEDDNKLEQEGESLGPLSSSSSFATSSNLQPTSLEPPPVPLPRTKSLLKKEQKNRQLQQQLAIDSTHTNSLPSTTSSTSSSSLTTNTCNNSSTTSINPNERKPIKRNAPPVPINFKRQVSGSLDAIEAELNEIGDTLATLEKEFNLCQDSLKATHNVDGKQFSKSRGKFIQVIRKKNAIVRRQRELMYRKRELQLDQIHSDIEYELRMIGNKQLSHRTTEDEIREKDLLKRLVEIVEEKSDIVENLNKDTPCDNDDIAEAFSRLNLTSDVNRAGAKNGLKEIDKSSKVLLEGENCDRRNTAMGNRLSKIATLLPKSKTLKSSIKIKPKRLFMRADSHKMDG